MDCKKVGNLIYRLRKEKNMTQKQLADAMNISDRTISKWERGLGCPDISLLLELSEILNVNIKEILSGDLNSKDFIGGNMKNSKFYVCSSCGNIILSTADADISCCGRKIMVLTPKKAENLEKLSVEVVENEWFISSNHSMSKDDYISFIAFATGDTVQIIKQYPEWNVETRIFKRRHGILIWYSLKDGLLYQYL